MVIAGSTMQDVFWRAASGREYRERPVTGAMVNVERTVDRVAQSSRSTQATLCLGALLTMFACVPYVESDVIVDGVPFRADGCRTGAANGFMGVDLIAPDEGRLRLSLDPRTPHVPGHPFVHSGTPVATLFAPGQMREQVVGLCGTLTVALQPSKVGYRNIKGAATLSCESPQHKISGRVSFEDCH